MKTVTVTISGEICSYLVYPQITLISQQELDSDEPTMTFKIDGQTYVKNSPYYGHIIGFIKIDSIYADGENIKKSMGKYAHMPFIEEGALYGEGSYAISADYYDETDVEFEIDLKDGEEFDPSKLQLIMSSDNANDYGVYGFNSRIYADKILYDGKEIYNDVIYDNVPTYFEDPDWILDLLKRN